jgi:hypothetical protein
MSCSCSFFPRVKLVADGQQYYHLKIKSEQEEGSKHDNKGNNLVMMNALPRFLLGYKRTRSSSMIQIYQKSSKPNKTE